MSAQHAPIWIPRAIEVWPVAKLVPYARNSRTHSQKQIDAIARSIERFGFLVPVLIDAAGGIIAGHGRTMAANQLHMPEVPCVVGSHLTEEERRAYVIADNQLAEMADWDYEKLALETRELAALGFDMSLLGFSDKELLELNPPADPTALEGQDDAIVPKQAVSRPGDLWQIGPHRLACGDCRDGITVAALAGGETIQMTVTSPPYAAQRKYDTNSPFQPVPADQYLGWYQAVAAAFQPLMAADGSYFCNIKEHAEDGQRHLYVKELVVAHARQWGWKFIDEFCWKKQGVPGGWKNRFKNAWEPIFHFALTTNVRFYPLDVSHVSDAVFDYSSAANQMENRMQEAAGRGVLENESGRLYKGLTGNGRKARQFVEVGVNERREQSSVVNRVGLARPSNVIEVATESEKNGHPASYPVALPEFFIRAFTKPGDLCYDPFMGSGTTMVAAEKNRRRALGCEISPLYTDMIILRMKKLFPLLTVTLVDGRSFEDVAAEREVTQGVGSSK